MNAPLAVLVARLENELESTRLAVKAGRDPSPSLYKMASILEKIREAL